MRTSGWILMGLMVHATLVGAANQPAVLVDETFEAHDIGALRAVPPLRRVIQVSVLEGEGRVGKGKVAHYDDASITEGGALEYSVGSQAPGRLFIQFDLLNNNPRELSETDALIFSVAKWDDSRTLSLNANASRAFGVEFSQMAKSRSVSTRVGSTRVDYDTYDLEAPQRVKIWVNDHDSNPLSYERPDTGEMVSLSPDSFVVWLNDALFGYQHPTGAPMQRSISEGDAVIGRIGFGSPSHGLADFLIDNLRVEDPTGESASAPDPAANKTVGGETTPTQIPGATTIPYRKGKDAMNLFVYRPDGWSAGDKRSALIYFFGGGWNKGTPMKSAGWARWAAQQGMVGVAPDYRTKNRFGTSPLESVADARAAFNWVVEHADKLGVDPNRIVVGGSSAGGHVALWTAIAETPPRSNAAEAPKRKPAALFLSSAVTDTSEATGYAPQRFGEYAEALSPVHQLDAFMPPTLMFHACDDELVDYASAVAFYNEMKSAGNECELISVPRGGHGFSTAFPEWKTKVREKFEAFLKAQQLLPSDV